MSDVANEIRREKARYQDVAFKVFAVVGFLSSIVTIVSWLSSTQASLSAIVNPTTIEIPGELQLSNLDSAQYDLDSAIEDLTGQYCNPINVGFDGDQSRNFFTAPRNAKPAKRCFQP